LAGDEEKNIQGRETTGPTMAVSGPGLGDLLTEGPTHGVFDLDHTSGTQLEAQLNRLEEMILRLQHSSASQDTLAHSPTHSPKVGGNRHVPDATDMHHGQTTDNRMSTSTVVVDGNNTIHPDHRQAFV